MKERITPQNMLRHLQQMLPSSDEIDIAPMVIGSWSRELVEALARELSARPVRFMPNTDFYTVHTDDLHLTLVKWPVGAPATVSTLEMLIAAGARRIIGVGLTGSLQPALCVGDIVLPAACLREEGTSYHYIPEGAEIQADPQLLQVLEGALKEDCIPFQKGTIWTTDAIFREMVETIEKYRDRQVLSVEMETSAMYAVGRFRDVQVCNILVVTDELWSDEWNPAGLYGLGGVRTSLERIKDCLKARLPVLSEPAAGEYVRQPGAGAIS